MNCSPPSSPPSCVLCSLSQSILERGHDRYIGNSSSAWSGQLISPKIGQDEDVVNSGNGSDLNYSSQPFMDFSGLPLPSAARFHFGNRNSQVQPSIYGQEVSFGMKGQHNGGIGEDIDEVPDYIHDLEELLLDSSDEVDIVKHDWGLQFSQGGSEGGSTVDHTISRSINMLRMGEVRNGGWKVHRCFDPNPFRTSARSLYGLEAIPTEFVRQTG